MNRSQTLPRLGVTALGLAVGVLTPLGPTLGQEPAAADLARPQATDVGADATRMVDDAPPTPPEILDLGLLADEVVAVLERMPASEWVLADLAAEIEGDPIAAFEFVRDHIGLDPYSGSLRSPQGTLAARAGNSVDRALLLQALLNPEATTRLAGGTLTDTTPAIARALAGASEPLPRPAVTEVMPFAIEAMTNRARRDHAALIEALGDDYDTLGAATDGDTALADHVWLQLLQDDGTWLDLDPTLADSTPGDALTAAETTYDELPADEQQTLSIRLVAESLTSDGPTTEVVLDETIPAGVAADRDLWLLVTPENPGAGGTLAGALGEAAAWVPVLFMQGDARSGSAFSLGPDSGEGGGSVLDDALGGLGGMGGGGESASDDSASGDPGPLGLTELRLQITSSGPGLEPQTAERVLLSGPVEEALPPALRDAHHLLISNGGLDLRRLAVARGAVTVMAAEVLAEPEAATEYRPVDQLLPWAVADRTLAAVSEHVIAPGLGRSGEMRAYVGRPRAWIVSHGIDVDGEAFSGTIDLALDTISLVGSPETEPIDLARERLWYGVLQTALETETARVRVRRSGSDPRLTSVSLDSAGTLERLDEAPAGDDASGADPSALGAALAAGAITLGAGYDSTGSFWRVDPRTGATSSVQEPGVRPSSYGGSYSGGGGGYYQINGDLSSRRLNAPTRRSGGGGGMEYQVVQGIAYAAAIVGAFSAGWLVGRIFVNVLDWMYSD